MDIFTNNTTRLAIDTIDTTNLLILTRWNRLRLIDITTGI